MTKFVSPSTITLLLALTVSFSVEAALFEADNYDDCIFDSMKDAKSEVAVYLAVTSCKNKFPDEGKRSAPGKSWFGPKNYDDCILQKTKGVTNEDAAAFIMFSCSNLFPQKK